MGLLLLLQLRRESESWNFGVTRIGANGYTVNREMCFLFVSTNKGPSIIFTKDKTFYPCHKLR